MPDYIEDSDLESGDTLTATNMQKISGARRGHLKPIDGSTSNYNNGSNDLGTSTNKWKDLHLSNDANIAGKVVATGGVEISGGTAIKHHIQNIGNWSFDNTLQQEVTVNIESSKVIDIKVSILDDNDHYAQVTSIFGLGNMFHIYATGGSNLLSQSDNPPVIGNIVRYGTQNSGSFTLSIRIGDTDCNLNTNTISSSTRSYWQYNTNSNQFTYFNDNSVNRGYVYVTYLP